MAGFRRPTRVVERGKLTQSRLPIFQGPDFDTRSQRGTPRADFSGSSVHHYSKDQGPILLSNTLRPSPLVQFHSMKPDRYSAAAKLSCEPYLLSPSAYSNDEIYLDTLPATVEAMRSGWIRAFQSAATVVRAPLILRDLRTIRLMSV